MGKGGLGVGRRGELQLHSPRAEVGGESWVRKRVRGRLRE
jgi:hypothetical protein